MATIKLNKVDVARRQLATALEMWFADGDPVAIHTLAMAAHEIAIYLAKRQSWKDMTIYERAVNRAKALSKTTSEVHRRMKGPANFFKHADLDPGGEFEFDEGMNEALLGMAVGCLLVLTHSLTSIENAYMIRLALEQPDRFPLPRSNTLSPEERAMLRDMSRQDYWADQKKAGALLRHQARQHADR
jgi:hypothetical protein